MKKRGKHQWVGQHKTLMIQFQLFRSAHRIRGIETRRTYDKDLSLFLKFCADEFNLQRIANLKPKHVEKYVEHRVHEGKSASTIKGDLSAIRHLVYLHPDIRNRDSFPSNEDLAELIKRAAQKRRFGGIDRTWTHEEFVGMCQKAIQLGRPKVAWALRAARWLGTRIHETCQLDHAELTAALKADYVWVCGKGGYWRQIPLNDKSKELFQDILKQTTRGNRVFVEGKKTVEEQIQSIQDFIQNHRKGIESGYRMSARDAQYLGAIGASHYFPHIHYHGLRHTYAKEQYTEFRRQGLTPVEARLKVAKLLGHGRDDVTRIYTVGHEDYAKRRVAMRPERINSNQSDYDS